MDNEAAEIFAKDTCFNSALKHIDTRQEWVKTLRDRNVCTPGRVSTDLNLADLFTKILGRVRFEYLRSQTMYNPDEQP